MWHLLGDNVMFAAAMNGLQYFIQMIYVVLVGYGVDDYVVDVD
jgi:hypothetical protein